METVIGERLKTLRKHKRLTAKEIADRIGISRPYYTQLEGSKRRLSVDNLLKIARVLDVSMPVIFGEGFRQREAVAEPFDREALRAKLAPLLGGRVDDLLSCFEMWRKTPRSFKRSLLAFAGELDRSRAGGGT